MNSNIIDFQRTYKELCNAALIPIRSEVDDELKDRVSLELIQTINSFICDLFLSDGNFNQTELNALSLALKTEVSPSMAMAYAQRWEDLSTKVPEFLSLAIQFDETTQETKLTEAIVSFIGTLGIFGALVDGAVSARERKRIDQYKTFLNACIQFPERAVSFQRLKKNVHQTGGVAITEKIDARETQAESLEKLMAELDRLIGLPLVKRDVATLVNTIRVRKLREQKGMQAPPLSLHLVFTGNPGTGKTTVARLLAKIYLAMGLLSKGHLIETDRSGIVAGYVGQTAIKVREKVQSALGGVLFIDEAYSLTSAKSDNDYGREAVDTLLKLMEDERKNLVVIVAGYTEPMKQFLQSNPGLESRFNKFLHFTDYEPQELYDIFVGLCTQNGYAYEEEFGQLVADFLKQRFEERGRDFGNARLVRNLFETVITNQANRVALIPEPTEGELRSLLPVDFPPVNPAAQN